ncbi:putative membrane protein YdfJ with MMPL/SSD domain [Pullulanibacillus pueri]|uniref:Membrane protein n=1 Tax=Pullulanibacillus pueri TaxID=1437324 RepID=A0A8J3EKV4_9BACL|nr:MMPL family transporter [Pullulanibacillus pueri]MBM7681079.1 putative membrane protein YdfJ with MMPL/SSD domain [Pullulanibacillus pueri]GGH76965.1 membrane protein [Pullulanibacillus pueri]
MESLLYTWGRFVAGRRGRWVTLSIWIIIAGVLSMIWPSVNSVEDNAAAQLPKDIPSVQASAIEKEQFPSDAGTPLLIVWNDSKGLQSDDFNKIRQLYQHLSEEPLKQQSFIPPLQKATDVALSQSVSKDGTTLVTPIFFRQNAEEGALNADLASLQKQVGKQAITNNLKDKGLHVRFTGPIGISTDAKALFGKADITLLIATILLVLILLIVLYRSPILAFVPLVAVGFSYGVISPILGLLGDKGWITLDTQAVSIMTVLLFGAGTDYCLFLITKYRESLLEEKDKHIALSGAIKSAGGAIMMSALTVVLGLSTLFLAHYGSYQRFAAPFSLAILIMGIAAVTLLPALLTIFGRVSFFPFIPRTPAMLEEHASKKQKPLRQRTTQSQFSEKIGKLVTQKPWLIIIICVIFLGGLASFSAKIAYSYDLLESFPKDMPSREGYTLISDKFSSGKLAPMKVIVDSEGRKTNVREVLQSLSYVKEVSVEQSGLKDHNIKGYDVTLKGNPYSPKAMNDVPNIKNKVVNALKQAHIQNATEKVWLGGETASLYDTKQVTDRDKHIIIPVVIGIIALLLILYLRSIIAMLYLIITVLLSYFSALGSGWLILHFGFDASTMQGLIPLYAFVFLVALGEDYNIFMISSIWKKSRIMPLHQAISNGVQETFSVITSAGLILAGTFLVLATLPIQVLLQFGTVTAIGVILDTFVVRPLLVPAITAVLGKYAFWPSLGKNRPMMLKREKHPHP